MKKIILTIVVVFAFSYSNAQDKEGQGNGFSKGDKFVEGAFSFRTGGVQDSWSFTPKIGYMIDNKIAVGGFLALEGIEDNANNKNSAFGIGGFVRYYFLSLGANKSFQAYGEFGLGYSALTSDPNVWG